MSDTDPASAASARFLPTAFGGAVCAARFKSCADDFKVYERLPFEADGDGPHWLVDVEKTNLNTLDLLDRLARRFRIPRRSIGYSGLKDRHAVTRQFITLPARGLAEAELTDAADSNWRVIGARAHRRKLRVGSHRQNAFDIRLRQIPPELTCRDALEARLAQISRRGVPNYFGPQRFGKDGANLRKAVQLFQGVRHLPRQQHRFAVSAARSFVFNAVVAARVRAGNWNALVEGDAIALEGSASWFSYEKRGDDAQHRLDTFDIHPSGPLWGTGERCVSAAAEQIERTAIADLGLFTAGLERLGLRHERRSLRMPVRELEWSFTDDVLAVRFVLPRGGFATSVLRELVTDRGLELPSSLPGGRNYSAG